ncbi:GGDEF domain-containing protein [Aliidiomarina iranensis]|uniref:GGDEF domain-containing protein n=1 Tax=Aliidiomarina iranensis TaxID=1434071 RepID=A0A432VRR6_9GAMM|nr:GGDEF domain-containing phosphodiesterase [Aliidiomarina iranensis]RUO19006.1 GGDEF domain-containing protein [Aliidiomarina iranensis]
MPNQLGKKSTHAAASNQTKSAPASKKSEQRFYELIESMPMVAVQGYDKQRRVIYWNDASRVIYGYTREEAEEQLLEDLIIPTHMREHVINAHQNWLDNNISIPAQELELQHKDGHLVPVFSSHVMIKQDTGECEMFCIDISLQEQKKAQDKLHWMANYDALTELPNRRLMEIELATRIAEAKRRANGEVAVVFIDLDNFKIINDTLGHHRGDELIRAVAASLQAETRSSDFISRFGGDEFVLVLNDYHSFEGISELYQRLSQALDAGFKINGLLYQVTASFGVSIFPHDGHTVGELLGNADAAMYQAKEKGKNSLCFYTSDINDRLQHYQNISAILYDALAADGLFLHFQPQIDLQDHHILSCEALLRCQDRNGEPLSPDVLIPIAEKSGLINRIGDWIIEAACQQLVNWQGTALEKVRIDINLSGKQLTNPNLAKQILNCLSTYGLKTSQLGVELTENEVIGSDELQIDQLKQLKNAGVHISIDDFGTGYSSLVYLSKLPVCSLKIDRSFLVHAMENESDMAIMKAIITVGHSLGLSVVVEGVETTEQDRLVKSLGCDLAQGYLYARPMPAGDMLKYLTSN